MTHLLDALLANFDAVTKSFNDECRERYAKTDGVINTAIPQIDTAVAPALAQWDEAWLKKRL